MQRLGAGELLGRLTLPGGIDGLADDPVIAVDCSSPDGVDAGAIAAVLAGVPAVVIAVGAHPGDAVAAALDVVAGDDGVLGRLAATVEARPLAATALAVLLRGADARSVHEGLVAESSTYAALQAGPEHRRWLAERADRAPRRPGGPEPLRVERTGDELHLTLQRPDVRNAFSTALRDALVDALAIATVDPAVRVIIDAEGPAFCSGGDLDEFGSTPDPATAHLVRLRRSAGRALAAVADRVTVRVHGACVGAGVELPSFAGRVEARRDARFLLPEVAMGLVPGAGGTVSISRRVGRQRTALLALTGGGIDAATALDWGLVDHVDE